MSTISVEEFLRCLDHATKTIKVAVRDRDFYARPEDITFEEIEIIDPAKLREAIRSGAFES